MPLRGGRFHSVLVTSASKFRTAIWRPGEGEGGSTMKELVVFRESVMQPTERQWQELGVKSQICAEPPPPSPPSPPPTSSGPSRTERIRNSESGRSANPGHIIAPKWADIRKDIAALRERRPPRLGSQLRADEMQRCRAEREEEKSPGKKERTLEEKEEEKKRVREIGKDFELMPRRHSLQMQEDLAAGGPGPRPGSGPI